MSTIKFEPIAGALARVVRADDLFPLDVLAQLRARKKEDVGYSLDAGTEDFLLHYMAVIAAGWQLLQAPQFDRLGALQEALEEEYMPGGPPMSPVYDSYIAQHVLAQVPHGMAGETPLSVVAWLTRTDAARALFHQLARELAIAHCDLFRVQAAEGLSATLEPIRGGAPRLVRLTGPFLRTGDRVLARVLRFRESSFIADSPYLLRASEQDWLDYLARETESTQRTAGAAPSPARPISKQKLSSKQLARQRQQQKRAAASVAPDHEVVRLLRHGRSERYWLDFIMDAYAGERNGIVYLAGVPDEPETLPHHAEYAGEREPMTSIPPMARVREALLRIAERGGILKGVEQQILDEGERAGLPRRPLEDAFRPLLTAYCTLGASTSTGGTALQELQASPALPADERAVVESLERGWFSVLRIERIELDRGFHMMDELRRKRLFVKESAATRQLGTGDILMGWLCQDRYGALTLEGGVLHVRAHFADAVVEAARATRDHVGSRPGEDWRQRNAALPPLLIVAVSVLLEPFRSAAKARDTPPLKLSPEMTTQMHVAVLDRIRRTLDEPIPQFQGKTLRNLARGSRSRADAVAWLREQERILKHNPQLAGLDLRPLWQELKLEYQGLDTDAR